jgi:hypothetical protein
MMSGRMKIKTGFLKSLTLLFTSLEEDVSVGELDQSVSVTEQTPEN